MTWRGVLVYISLLSTDWVVLILRNRRDHEYHKKISPEVLATKTNPLPEISDRKSLDWIQVSWTRAIFRSWKVTLSISFLILNFNRHICFFSKTSLIISKQSVILKVCSLATWRFISADFRFPLCSASRIKFQVPASSKGSLTTGCPSSTFGRHGIQHKGDYFVQFSLVNI